MGIFIYTGIFVILVLIYVIFSSSSLQFYLNQRKLKKTLIDEILKSVKGDFQKKGYFAVSHKIIKPEEFNSYSTKHKLPFTICYNIITFRTQDAYFEFFFHVVKDGVRFSEIMDIRVFPKENKIKSEGNVEKNYSRINIFTNNRYLTDILELHDVQDNLKWLLRNNGDILLIHGNNLHYKVFLKPKNLTAQRLLDMIKALNHIKNKVYRENVLEY